ncbi:DUF433 domain-containing protein [Leptolyngbya boryana CZ1]|uniref:DUF433 domain-containing protein n=1 Tax=Leptolyngbya boryana CZ1 TaxID=3060204 RepID=A0AA96WRS6_LEPBY|nr:DUF433 domain-containing protein [Leptolyngbya boryana]WNZ44278.1 DUF433 domain-containing protein [Leptolyngbya boryana CZ1]
MANLIDTLSRHIRRESEHPQSEPIITDTPITVRDIILLWKSGIRPEAIPETLYNLVTPAQVFDAISFYLDNEPEIDEWISWYAARPHLNVPATLRLSPLWDNVIENIAAERRAIDAEFQAEEA